jgi:hypothetical protein
VVAKIVNGKNIRGVLHYNENKIASGEAELLMAAGFPAAANELSFKNKLDWFDRFTRQNEHTKTNTMHVMLNFSRLDKVENELLRTIALDYMNKIGFGDQPFLVYRHYDAAHPHIHIATVNIANGGSRLETHNIGKNQSEKARREIEEQYGLIKAEEQQKEANYIPNALPLEKAIYGKRETKAAISAIVREVVGTYKFTSLPELNAILGQFNVRAYRGAEGTRMYEKGGLVYGMINMYGEPVGIPIKASSIYSSPTLKNLEKKYIPNETARKPYGLRLKHLLDKALATGRDIEDIKAQLQVQGLRVLLRENAQGQVYGVTFIDNATRVVFNGSDLGKAYSAKAFMERLPANALLADQFLPQQQDKYDDPIPADTNVSAKTNGREYPAHDQPVFGKLIDALLSARHEPNTPDPYRRKKKRRLLS